MHGLRSKMRSEALGAGQGHFVPDGNGSRKADGRKKGAQRRTFFISSVRIKIVSQMLYM